MLWFLIRIIYFVLKVERYGNSLCILLSLKLYFSTYIYIYLTKCQQNSFIICCAIQRQKKGTTSERSHPLFCYNLSLSSSNPVAVVKEGLANSFSKFIRGLPMFCLPAKFSINSLISIPEDALSDSCKVAIKLVV